MYEYRSKASSESEEPAKPPPEPRNETLRKVGDLRVKFGLSDHMRIGPSRSAAGASAKGTSVEDEYKVYVAEPLSDMEIFRYWQVRSPAYDVTHR
jgi:hypothetical protein